MRKVSALILGGALLAAPGLAAGEAPAADDPGYTLPRIRPAPEISLLDQRGERARLSDYRGELVLLTFIYTSCPGACPLVTGKLLALEDELNQHADLPPVRIVGVTLDPAYDTPQVLAEHAHRLDVEDDGWVFLTGSQAEVARVLEAYNLWWEKQPDGLIDHVMRVYLIDRQGDVREIYNTAFLRVPLVLEDIRTLK